MTYPDFARSQIHGHAWNLEALELLFQNKPQDVTNMEYNNSISFTATQQYWQQQSYWVRRTESMKKIHTQQKVTVKLTVENDLFFFPSETKKKTLKKHTEIMMKHKHKL